MLQSLNLPEPLFYSAVVLMALVLVMVSIPSIIHVANGRSLFDDMDIVRKKHKQGIARLGGIAVFCSFMITCLLVVKVTDFQGANILCAACIILFVVGLKDDLWGVNPSTKFGMQLIVSAMMVFLADVRLTSMYGVFNIHDISYATSVSLSILVIMFLINAFNLIDGIDGLVGVTGLVVNGTLGLMFVMMEQSGLACMAFAIAGACIGFLRFNITPARIFMGDTGSLLLGFLSAILAIKFIELNKVGSNVMVYYGSAPSIAVAILIGPIFDAIRVFTLRSFKKGSPFVGDRNHIHHRVLELGFNHLQTTVILMFFNIIMIIVAFLLRGIGNFLLMGILFLMCILFNHVLTFLLRSKSRKRFRLVNFLW